jgi:two-component system, NtrC family, sensor kinase
VNDGVYDPEDAGLLRERMASLGTLVAGMAHEINNPITYLIANLAELERIGAAARTALGAYQDAFELAAPESVEPVRAAEVKLQGIGGLDLAEELLEECSEGAARIRDLVRDLLALARPEAERATSRLDVHALLEFVVRMLKVELRERAEIVRDYQATLPVRAAKGSLALVLLNLIRNAAQACADGDPEQSRIALRTRDEGASVELAIEDNGCGVAPEARAQLFSAGFTTKPGVGTGMGLCVSRRLVEEQGGTLEFAPAARGGAIFTLRLPRAS